MIRLGYLVPEFPGQTHTFFWRELNSLAEMGVECDIVSTRPPAKKLMSQHAWSDEATARTTYLAPPTVLGMLDGLGAIIMCGPAGWWRVMRGVAKSKVGGLKSKARLVGLAVAGGRLAAIARRRQWKHLQVHSCADSAHVALFAHLVSGMPYSLMLHGPLEDYGPNQAMKWGNAAFGIVVNHKLLAELRAALGAAAPVEIDVATMGVNVSIFHRSAPYRPWDGGGPFRIFSCGRLNPCKGHGDLIQAVSLLRDKGVDAHLEIAGADDSPGHSQPMLEKLEKQIDVLNLKDRVVLLGTVSEQVVLEGLEKSHVFALASLNEPRSVAIMEAMAMGTPVVATRSGGTAETVDDGVDGILVEPLNPTDVAKGLELVARDGNLATRLASAGREKIVRSYQSDQNARNILRHLEN